MKRFLSTCLLIATSSSFAAAQPQTFDQIVVFGDSLSDVGNLHSDRPHVAAPDPPYSDGRFSNGPNWVDRLAEHLGAERPLASELGGKNYAWAAATARDDLNWFFDLEPDFSVPSIPDQVSEFFEDGGPQGNQLFVVWAGHNDIWPKYGDDRDVEKSVSVLTSQLTRLLDSGIQHLIVPNLTIHERIGPEVVPDFNSKLADQISELRVAYRSTTIYEFDHSAFMDAIVSDPTMFGITEPIAPACRDCWGGPGKEIVANPDEHFFWDRHHISAKGNQLLADEVYRQFFSRLGDFDLDGLVDAKDVDLLRSSIINQNHDLRFDLTNDQRVNREDLNAWVHDVKSTWFGDANLDGEFNSGDLVAVFQAGEYEDGIVGNSAWEAGDWNGDAEFDTGDLVFAFQDGGFEVGRRTAVASVPEPSSIALLCVGILGAFRQRRMS